MLTRHASLGLVGPVFLVGIAVALAGAIGAAAAAGADPARPANYRSVVTGIEPATPALHVSIVGGDSFVRVVVERGHTLEVTGYAGEPYLRIGAAGVVEQNRRSPAVALNSSRYGEPASPDADAHAAPAWERIGSGGTWLWHDHRTHWMSTVPPVGLARRAGKVSDWTIPMTVDGAPVSVSGELLRVVPPNASWWWGTAVVAGAGVALAVLVRRRRLLVTVAAGALALTAAVQGAAAWLVALELPTAAGRRPVFSALALVAAAGGAVALAVRRIAIPVLGGAAVAAAMGVWLQHDQWSNRILLGTGAVPATVQRLALAAMGAAVVVAVVAVVAGLAVVPPRVPASGPPIVVDSSP